MELATAIRELCAVQPQKIILSAPTGQNTKYRRASLEKLGAGWQLERRSETQAFHENLPEAGLEAALHNLLQTEFTQATALGGARGYSLRISKKGRVLAGAQKGSATPAPARSGHDRHKKKLLAEGEAIPPLVEMGVFTKEGRVAAGMHDKYRQINRFVELVDHALSGALPQRLRVVDFGCGKSYLTFILYYYLHTLRGVEVEMTGLDLKAEVVAHCNEAAEKHGYTGLHFEVGDIARYAGEGVDMVVTLHACDTATDLALAHAVAWGAHWIFSVPCCQHELNAQMDTQSLAILTRYGILQERMAALMTDAVRANLLRACGYKTQVTEFVELEHTPKNLMLRAHRAHLPKAERALALDEVERLCAEFSFSPTLLRILRDKGLL